MPRFFIIGPCVTHLVCFNATQIEALSGRVTKPNYSLMLYKLEKNKKIQRKSSIQQHLKNMEKQIKPLYPQQFI